MNMRRIWGICLIAASSLIFYFNSNAAEDTQTNLSCTDDQTLWVYEIGTPNTSIDASETDGGQSVSSLQSWEASGKTYWTAMLTGLPSQISTVKTLGKIVLKPGFKQGDLVSLGQFQTERPIVLSDAIRGVDISPSPTSTGLPFNLEMAAADLSDPDIAGTLYYVIEADAGFEYARLALCSYQVIETSGTQEIRTASTVSEETEVQANPEPKLKTEPHVNQADNNEIDTLVAAEAAIEDNLVQKLNQQVRELGRDVDKSATVIAKLEQDLTSRDQLITSAINSLQKWKGWAILLGLLSILLGFLLFLIRRSSSYLAVNANFAERPRRQNEEREKPERVAPSGVIFANSPMAAANVTTPLSPAGQLSASNLQMLNGPYAVLRPAYHATGRIGFPQEGKPSAADYSLGTGFLITSKHIVTNLHVYGTYSHYLEGDNPCGVEFIAEKDKDASDFIAFNGKPPLVLPGLDLVIYELSRSAANRAPIPLRDTDLDELDKREIVVIGYPDTSKTEDKDILAVVEDNPIFAVKRISQGRFFRHSTDTDQPFGVTASVNIDVRNKFQMPAVCHNASTLGGNSGSPILDIKTGKLLGIHFAGYKVFNEKEAANLAMVVAQLSPHTKGLVAHVTAITDEITAQFKTKS